MLKVDCCDKCMIASWRSIVQVDCERVLLHDLILRQTGSLSLHGIAAAAAAGSLVFDEAQTERTTTVLVTGELLNGSVGILGRIESDHTSSTGTTVWLVLNLGLLNLANCGEQLDKIFVAG